MFFILLYSFLFVTYVPKVSECYALYFVAARHDLLSTLFIHLVPPAKRMMQSRRAAKVCVFSETHETYVILKFMKTKLQDC